MIQHREKPQRVSVDDSDRRRPTLTPSQPQSADSSDEYQDPRMGADQLNRTRAHHPLGPRSSINRGLVQGQPRIFASMNTGTDFQQEPLVLKQGQPRIFASGNRQDPQPRSTNGPQPSPGHTRGNQSRQEPPPMHNSRAEDIKGKGVDRSGMDTMVGFQQQQPERLFDQQDNQTLPYGQTGGPPIRTVYTEAKSPAMQYRASLEKGKDSNRVGRNGPSVHRPTEPQSLLPPSQRQPIRRTTERHLEPSPPAPLRKDSFGSNNEHQQRFISPRGQSVDQQHPPNLNSENVTYKLSRHQSLYSPVVAVTTNLPDAEFLDELDEAPIPSPKTSRSFGQRPDSAQREPGRYNSPPTLPSFKAEGSPPPANGFSSGDINIPNRGSPQNRDPRRQPVAWNVQSSTASLSTQDSSRKDSFTSFASVSSDRERDQNPTIVEPQPSQNRPHNSTRPLRSDNDKTSPPHTHHQYRERLKTGAAPTNRGSQMDSFYGGDASLSGTKGPNMRKGEEVNHTDIGEEPEPYFYPLELHLLHPQLLRALLQYLSFYDWCTLQAVNKNLRSQLSHAKELKEEILERYLSTIGYARWTWEEDEPLIISLRVKSSWLSPVIVLMSIYRILVNTCVVFRYQHTSTPESQTATCKRGPPPCRKRRK